MTEAELREFSEAVKRAAHGRWVDILVSLAPHLAEAADRMPHHVPCPIHGGKDGFRFCREAKRSTDETGITICNTCGIHADGWATLMWANSWSFGTAFKEVAHYLGMRVSDGPRATPAVPIIPPKVIDPEQIAVDDAKRRSALQRIANQSLSISHPAAEPARLYLARRGISVAIPDTLRFSTSLPYYADENTKIGDFPVLIAMVSDKSGKPVTIHRTFLTRDGKKAPVDCPKKLMMYPSDRSVSGGAIRIAGRSDAPIACAAEGIETSLAVLEAFQELVNQGTVSVWCTVTAGLMAQFEPPAGIDQLFVFADKDRPCDQHPKGHGQEAALQLVQRCWASGIKASAVVPKGDIPAGAKSLDWLDILNRDGIAGFPVLRTNSEERKVA